MRHIATKEPASVRLCVLLDKVSRRTAHVKCDYVGYECPDEFVVGYGMVMHCCSFVAELMVHDVLLL
jgi:hypoxanthine-guanine phosphoribosyltransferase